MTWRGHPARQRVCHDLSEFHGHKMAQESYNQLELGGYPIFRPTKSLSSVQIIWLKLGTWLTWRVAVRPQGLHNSADKKTKRSVRGDHHQFFTNWDGLSQKQKDRLKNPLTWSKKPASTEFHYSLNLRHSCEVTREPSHLEKSSGRPQSSHITGSIKAKDWRSRKGDGVQLDVKGISSHRILGLATRNHLAVSTPKGESLGPMKNSWNHRPILLKLGSCQHKSKRGTEEQGPWLRKSQACMVVSSSSRGTKKLSQKPHSPWTGSTIW